MEGRGRTDLGLDKGWWGDFGVVLREEVLTEAVDDGRASLHHIGLTIPTTSTVMISSVSKHKALNYDRISMGNQHSKRGGHSGIVVV